MDIKWIWNDLSVSSLLERALWKEPWHRGGHGKWSVFYTREAGDNSPQAVGTGIAIPKPLTLEKPPRSSSPTLNPASTKPHPSAPHPRVFWALPGSVIPALLQGLATSQRVPQSMSWLCWNIQIYLGVEESVPACHHLPRQFKIWEVTEWPPLEPQVLPVPWLWSHESCSPHIHTSPQHVKINIFIPTVAGLFPSPLLSVYHIFSWQIAALLCFWKELNEPVKSSIGEYQNVWNK